MKYKGIIFDFNGVLWFDSHLQEQVWRQMSIEIRGIPLSLEEITIHVHGRNNRHALEYLTGESLSVKEIENLTEKKEETYRRLCLAEGDRFTLSPGATELFEYLIAHRIPHTIATASEKTNLDFFINHLSLEKWFNRELIVYDDGSFPGKPSPDIYLRAARNIGLEPGVCVVVEDSVSGIEAAATAGIGCVIALGPDYFHDKLQQREGVCCVVETMEQISGNLFTELTD